jgi:hypothetical protein
MQGITYKLFNEHYRLLTDSAEMHAFLLDVLEKHVVVDAQVNPKYDIRIPWLSPEKRRYLTRTAPSPEHVLTEVSIREGTTLFSAWNSTAPPLVPFNLDVIDGRYFAFHAAAIEVPRSGAIILFGNKGAGKSTNSLALCKEQGWSLLTDETCVIDAHDLSIHALLRQPHGYEVDEQRVARKSVLRYADNPWLVTASVATPRLAFELVHIQGLSIPHVQPISDPKIATQVLLRHQLQFGSSPVAALACAKALAANVQLSQIHHGGYESFALIRETILSSVNRMFA